MNPKDLVCPRCGGKLHFTNLKGLNTNGLPTIELLATLTLPESVFRMRCLRCKRRDSFFLYFEKLGKWYNMNMDSKEWFIFKIESNVFIFR